MFFFLYNGAIGFLKNFKSIFRCLGGVFFFSLLRACILVIVLINYGRKCSSFCIVCWKCVCRYGDAETTKLLRQVCWWVLVATWNLRLCYHLPCGCLSLSV